MEQLVEWDVAGETEVVEANLPQCHFLRHKSHMTWSRIEILIQYDLNTEYISQC
jgi:hypothetical protein